MKPEIISIKKTGLGHIAEGKGCEDAFCISDDRTVICVADGVSNAAAGGIGAEYLTRQMCKILSFSESKNILEKKSNETVRGFVHQNIVKTIDRLALQQNRPRDDFASTFLAIVRTSENSLVIIHAGDGAVFAKPNNQQTHNGVIVLSYPDNYSGGIYSAASDEQKSLMRVLRVNPDDYMGIVLCTDGFSDAFINSETRYLNSSDLSTVFYAESEEDLDFYIKSCHLNPRNNINDDITCVYYRMFSSAAPEKGQTGTLCAQPDAENANKEISCHNESEKASADKKSKARGAEAKTSDDMRITVRQADNKRMKNREKHKKDEKTGFIVSPSTAVKSASQGKQKHHEAFMIAVVFSVLSVLLAMLTVFNVSRMTEELKMQIELIQEEIRDVRSVNKILEDELSGINEDISFFEQFHTEENASEETASSYN